MVNLIATITGCAMAYIIYRKFLHYDKYKVLIESVSFAVGFWVFNFIVWLVK